MSKKWKTTLANLFLRGFVFLDKKFKQPKSFDPTRDFCSLVIFSTTALGDLMFNTPAIRAIRNRYPDAFITLVSSEKNKVLVSECAYFQQVIYWDEKVKDILNLVSALRKLKPEIAIILHSKAPYDILSAVMSGCEYVIKDIYGNKKTGMEEWLINTPNFFDGHLIQRKMNLIGQLSCDTSNTEMFIPMRLDMQDKIAGPISIGFQMGASEAVRCWPVSRFIELAEKIFLLGEQYQIVLIGTSKEKEYEKVFLAGISDNNKARIVSYIGKTDLRMLLGVIKNVDVLVTGDTGPLHLAVALKTKTISLFVTANPKHTGPYQNHNLHQIIYVSPENINLTSMYPGQPLSVIEADDVLARVKAIVF